MTFSLHSLTARLLLAVALQLVLFLGVTGYALDRAYEKSQLAGQGEQLFIRIFNLISVASFDDNQLDLPRALREQRFNSPESGLIGMVLDADRQPIWRSLSSEWFTEEEWLKRQPALSAGDEQFGVHADYVYQRNGFVWEDSNGQEQYFEFWVLESAEPFRSSLQTFRRQLWGSFIALSVCLMVSMLFVTLWGLKPLRLLASRLHRIRIGKAESLTGDYPQELTPLTNSLNQLLVAERTQRERYRQAMGDLAHSLKTPLAILRNESPAEPLINEQIDRMDQIVRYQLHRAVTDSRTGSTIGQHCQLDEVILRIAKALTKAYQDDDKALEVEGPEQAITVAMDSNDVFEIFGNLIDNALKYGRSLVVVSFQLDDTSVEVCVDDDGPGIDAELHRKIFARGQRLDTLTPGQGIGLSMVKDILASYRIELSVGASPFGGARFAVRMPRLND
ncbi:ATP-binding protein [Reinekea thalattae]|uniref:histidine kinase n=1 Tax=Reinekea thalattae TaxID=2593301 RepID=A0A5C8Z8D0_9GAMM|nr:ATP-binding protein [Reinekea thalattae]TXR53106.1 two-component sensor histidine kinase [Reinekea thalattae]